MKQLVEEYRGREDVLFRKLSRKYGHSHLLELGPNAAYRDTSPPHPATEEVQREEGRVRDLKASPMAHEAAVQWLETSQTSQPEQGLSDPEPSPADLSHSVGSARKSEGSQCLVNGKEVLWSPYDVSAAEFNPAGVVNLEEYVSNGGTVGEFIGQLQQNKHGVLDARQIKPPPVVYMPSNFEPSTGRDEAETGILQHRLSALELMNGQLREDIGTKNQELETTKYENTKLQWEKQQHIKDKKRVALLMMMFIFWKRSQRVLEQAVCICLKSKPVETMRNAIDVCKL